MALRFPPSACRPILALAFLVAQVPQAATSWKFDFSRTPQPGFIGITPASKYTSATGYGFDFGSDTLVTATPSGDGIEGLPAPKNPYDWTGLPFYAPARSAFFFSANVPAGNYEVQIVLGSQDTAVRATIRAEQRRLMIEDWRIPAGQMQTRIIHVNRRTDTIAGTKTPINLTSREWTYVDLDNRLTLEFNGDHPVVNQLVITKVDTDVTVYLAGSSTVADAQAEPYSSWGMNLPRFFKPGVAISNQAVFGLSSTSFLGQKRLQNILGTLKKDDLVFVSFGENDQRLFDTQSPTRFTDSLRDILKQVTAKKGIVLFVTPAVRNSFLDSTVTNTLMFYPDSMRSVAAQTKSPLLDLNALGASLLEALGPDSAGRVYVNLPANTLPHLPAIADRTHLSDYGGYELARMMASAIRKQNLSIAKYLSDDYVDFDPAKPDPYTSFALPFSPDPTVYHFPDESPDTCSTDSLVCSNPSSGVIRRSSSGDASIPSIRNAWAREGVLTLDWMGNTAGAQVRVHGLDGKLLISTALPGGSESVLLPMPRTSHRLLLVELVRDGRILDQRRIVPQ